MHAKTVAERARISSDTPRDVSGALLAAFRDLMLERGYRRVTVRNVVERAGVARSTFYEHYEDKEDILRESMRPLLAVLAACVTEAPSTERVRALLEHFREHSRLAPLLLRAPLRAVIVGFLAEEIEAAFERRVPARRAAGPTLLPPALAAAHVAGAQFALIEGWLHERPPSPSDAVARALAASSRALRAALLGD